MPPEHFPFQHPHPQNTLFLKQTKLNLLNVEWIILQSFKKKFLHINYYFEFYIGIHWIQLCDWISTYFKSIKLNVLVLFVLRNTDHTDWTKRIIWLENCNNKYNLEYTFINYYKTFEAELFIISNCDWKHHYWQGLHFRKE